MFFIIEINNIINKVILSMKYWLIIENEMESKSK